MLTLSGRHNCLWCTIKGSDLKVPLHERGRFPPRTLDSIKADNERFVQAGGNLRRAKMFNNAIGQPFFAIPIDNV